MSGDTTLVGAKVQMPSIRRRLEPDNDTIIGSNFGWDFSDKLDRNSIDVTTHQPPDPLSKIGLRSPGQASDNVRIYTARSSGLLDILKVIG